MGVIRVIGEILIALSALSLAIWAYLVRYVKVEA
jgi:hypothetical protein